MPGPKRKSPRLRDYDYSTAGPYFVTICTRKRALLFGVVIDDEVRPTRLGRIVADCWAAIPARYSDVELDTFVLMPDHVHGIVWLARAGQAPPLPRLIGSFKSDASRAAGRPLWQRSYYDRVIRGEHELQALREYIAQNPLRWALDEENPSRS